MFCKYSKLQENNFYLKRGENIEPMISDDFFEVLSGKNFRTCIKGFFFFMKHIQKSYRFLS